MSHSGVEAKPPWRTVPRGVRRAAEELLGTEVRRALRVWGGYSPTPTYRLRLADGRGAFFKAVGPVSNDFARGAHAREERTYRELSDLIAPWAPTFRGAFRWDAWHVLLLDDLGPKSVPPWTSALARGVSRALGDFHRSTLGAAFPSWLPPPEQQFLRLAPLWERVSESGGLRVLADRAGDQATDALRWLDLAVPVLSGASRSLADAGPPYAFLHGDVRSDNLRWSKGRLYLFDWPHVRVGPAEYDAAAFGQSVATEGGPGPDQIMAWYSERAPVRPAVLDAAIAAFAGFLADQAWQPDIPGLPRLRPFQRRQLRVTLMWAARRLRLPRPTWLNSVREER